MASLLTPTEATEVVERLIRRVYPDREEDAWIDLVERSLGVPEGSLFAELRDPDEASAAEVVARLRAQVGELPSTELPGLRGGRRLARPASGLSTDLLRAIGARAGVANTARRTSRPLREAW